MTSRGASPWGEFTLSDREALVLSFTKLWLMAEDRRQAGRQTVRYLQTLIFKDYSETVGARLAEAADSVLDPLPPAHRDRIADALRDNHSDRYLELLDGTRVVEALWDTVRAQDRALLLAIELVAFSPWGDGSVLKGDESGRKQRLEFISENFGAGFGRDTLNELDEDLRALTKRLRRLPRNPKKLLAYFAGGVAAGAITGGLAAPAIGGSIGASMGLSGAAATNAGLALLGGGSLASGGLGMAGGTALIAGAGAAMGGGAAAAGGAFLDDVQIPVGEQPPSRDIDREARVLRVPGTADEAAVDGAKLVILVRDVVFGAQSDYEKAEAIQADVEELKDATAETVGRLGGGDRTNRKSDQLTQIWSALEKTATELEEMIDSVAPE